MLAKVSNGGRRRRLGRGVQVPGDRLRSGDNVQELTHRKVCGKLCGLCWHGAGPGAEEHLSLSGCPRVLSMGAAACGIKRTGRSKSRRKVTFSEVINYWMWDHKGKRSFEDCMRTRTACKGYDSTAEETSTACTILILFLLLELDIVILVLRYIVLLPLELRLPSTHED